MNTVSIRVAYRPVRLGLCVERGIMEDLERALRLTHTLWGGRVNPILPIDAEQDGNERARALVEVFGVDALYPVADVSSIRTFIERYKYLPWPKYERELFLNSGVGTYASFLDV